MDRGDSMTNEKSLTGSVKFLVGDDELMEPIDAGWDVESVIETEEPES